MALLASGCHPSDACSQDPIACGGDVDFDTDARCASDSLLQVSLGFGEGPFTIASAPPRLVFGSQGGQHIFVSTRVTGAELAQYDRLEAVFTASVAHASDRGGSREIIGERRIVFGEVEPLRIVDGVVEETGYVLVLGRIPDAPVTVDLTVTDPCGRTGQIQWVGVLDAR